MLKRLTLGVLKILTVATSVSVMLGYIATLISPEQFALITLFGLFFPIAVLFHVSFIIFWFFIRKRIALYAALVLFSGSGVLLDFFVLSSGGEDCDDDFSLMSFNVRLFDVYDWVGGASTKDEIFEFINREQPDIICFQEFYYTPNETPFRTREPLKLILKTNQVHEHYTHEKAGQQFFGGATFSKFPIINKGEVKFESDLNNYAMFTDIVRNEDTIRVYNVHLASIRFQKEDYAYLENNGEKKQIDGGMRIAKMLMAAFEKRTEQTEKVIESIQLCPYPVLLCGDFNDTPVSYNYQIFRDLLKDSFREKGNGLGRTYNGNIPGLRIDHILFSEELTCNSYQRFTEDYSDHFPIMARFSFYD